MTRSLLKFRRRKPPKAVDAFDTKALRRAADRLTGWKWTGDESLDPPLLLRNAANEIDRLVAYIEDRLSPPETEAEHV